MKWLSRAGIAALVLGGVAPAQTNEDASENDASEEVVVTATRTKKSALEVPASVASQDVEALRQKGFTYGTDEFRGVPGIFFRRGEGDGDEFPFVSIRGSSGTEGYLALIDGVPFLGPDEEPLLNQVPYDALERVEIVKGPVSALYGRGGLYGVINYITKVPREGGSAVELTVGSDDYYRGAYTYTKGFDRGGLMLSGSYEDYGGWRVQGGKEILNLFGRLEYDLTDRLTLDATVNYFDRASEAPNGIPTTPEGDILPIAGGREGFFGYGRPLNETEGLIGSLRLTYRHSDNLTFSIVGQARRFDQTLRLNFYDPYGLDLSRGVVGFNGFVADQSQTTYFTEATVAYENGAHSIVAGISGERSTSRGLDAWSGQNGFTDACGYTFYLIEVSIATGEVLNADHPCFVLDDPLTRDSFTNTFWGAFIQDEIRLSDNWRLTLGARYDSFKRTAQVASPPSAPEAHLSGEADAFSPKAALSYVYDGGQIYFAYGRGFNSNFGTTFEWDAAQYARPENKPSTLTSYELGWKTKLLDGRLQIETAVFYTEQTNRRQFVPNPDAEFDPTAPTTLIAYGSLYKSQGFEFSARLTPWKGGALTAQYSWIDPEWADYVILSSFGPPVDLSGKTPTGVARHIVYLAAEQEFARWLTGRATYEYYSDYEVTQVNNLRDGSYQLVTLGATIAPPDWPNLALDLTLTNALDEEYYYHFGGRSAATVVVPGAPRQFRATLRAKF